MEMVPITSQPVSSTYMTSQAILPLGLQQLSELGGVKIKQHVELLEVLTPLEISNVYDIMTPNGKLPIFRAEEKSGVWARNCCGKWRGFEMRICDHSDQIMFTCRRDFRCCVCMCSCDCMDWCCDAGRDKIFTYGENGELYGHVEESGNCCCKVRYTVHDRRGDKVYTLVGPCCESTLPCLCPKASFKVYDYHSGDKCGVIYKEWSGILREGFSDSDNFAIEFPHDIDVKMKAVLVGAVFLIDMKHFEKEGATGNR